MSTVLEPEALVTEYMPPAKKNYPAELFPERETLVADYMPPAKKNYPADLLPERGLGPEERTNLTIEEAEALANGEPFELIDGRMVFKMADRKHSRIQITLGAKLYNYFEANPIGEVFTGFSLRLWPENKYNFRVPDIAVFLNENLHDEEKYETRGPDLAIEIVSDDDPASEVFAKAGLYLEKGSRVVWVIFPTEKRVTIITPEEWRWESATLTCPEILPGFSLAVEKIFSAPARKAS